MEFLLFGAQVWFWVAVLIFAVIAIASDAGENGWWAGVTFVGFAALWYFKGNLGATWPTFITWQIAGAYLLLGLIHTVFRIFIFGRSLGKRVTEARLDWIKSYNRDTKNEKLPTKGLIILAPELENQFQESDECRRAKNTNLRGHVFRWWLNWPFSLLWYVLSDFLRQVWDWVYDIFANLFNAILNAGIQSGDKAATRQQK